MTFQSHADGYAFTTAYAYAFFSFGHLRWEDLPNRFPYYTFHRVKQVHGDQSVEAPLNSSDIEADALFTRKSVTAVTVATADCLPILILNPDVVFAIHAGWRGIRNEIVLKTLQPFGHDFCSHPLTIALIGPHIGRESFEVDRALAEEFQQQHQIYQIANGNIVDEEPVVLPHKARDDKAYVNLHALAVRQLRLAGIRPTQIHSLAADTMRDTRFASFRRDKEAASRNFSFVCRL